MRQGVVISGVLHAAALLVSYVGLPHWLVSEPEPIEQPMVVDLVTIADETRAAPPKAQERQSEEPPPKPQAKPAPPPQAAPQPPKSEVAVVVPEEKPEAPPEPRAVPTPRAKPSPPKKSEDKATAKDDKRYKFDPSRIAALIDKTPRKESAPEVPPEQDRPAVVSRTARAFEGQALTLSEVDALRAQIEKCWIVQAGARYAEELVVRIRIYLNPDGTLRGEPQIVDRARLESDPYFRAAAESAARAILKCQPFRMPADKYDRWRDIELTFDTREMLG
jgi:outer membrane biosynthesis protein TonB